MNLTIGLAASFSLYESNPVLTSFVNSFNSEISHLSRLLSLIFDKLIISAFLGAG